jgi:hypothetical protein
LSGEVLLRFQNDGKIQRIAGHEHLLIWIDSDLLVRIDDAVSELRQVT